MKIPVFRIVSLALLLCLAPLRAQETGDAGKAEPSEPAFKAAQGLLLDVVNTGSQLIAVGEHGNILRSTDGSSWTQVPAPARPTLTAVFFVDATHGWAVGHDAAILHTADSGASWVLQNFQPELNQALLDVFFLDTSRGWAVGTFGLFLQTQDGGKTWSAVEAPVIAEEGSHLNAMIRLRDGQLLLAGERGFIAISSDGMQWDKLASPYEGSFFGALPMGDKGALVFGLRGNAFLSSDPRAEWTPVDLGSTRTAFGGTLLPGDRALVVGADDLGLVVGADGSVKDAGFLAAGTSSTGTISAAAAWNEKLVLVGESGVQTRAPGR